MTSPDLSTMASTMLEFPTHFVSRDNIISLLSDSLSPEKKVLVLHGPTGIGKTTILSQFVHEHSDHSISFFVGDDQWAAGGRRFLFDLSQQMLLAIGRPLLPSTVSGDRLRQVFDTTLATFTGVARRSSTPYYLIVDALDEAAEDGVGDGIRQLFPTSLARARNVFVLLSTSGKPQDLLPGIPFAEQRVPLLSLQESERLLDGLDLSSDAIDRLHETSGGMPGYLHEIRRQITEASDPISLIERPPPSLVKLIQQEWDRIVTDTDALALAVLAFAPGPVESASLEFAAGTDAATIANRFPFLKLDGERVSFLTGAHRRYASDRLKTARATALDKLVAFYERDPESAESIDFLPALLVETDNYERLRELAQPAFLAAIVRAHGDPSAASRLLGLTARAAHAKGDLPTLTFCVSAAAILKTVIEESGTAQAEISALAALGEYETATLLAANYVTNREQLSALGSIGRAMIEANLKVSPEIEDAIDEIASTVSGPMPAEDAARIAASFFAVRPDTAIQLVERCAGGGSGRALDRAFAMLSISAITASSASDSFAAIHSRIRQQAVRDFAARFPSLANMSADDVLGRLAAMEEVSSKLQLLRDWCNGNREDPAAYRVTSRALDLIAEAKSYTPSTRLLRQLAEPLRAGPIENVRAVAERFMLLAEGLPDRPRRERVRLELLLAEEECRWSWDQGADRILNIYRNYATTGHAEARASAIAQVMVSTYKVDPSDERIGLRAELQTQLRSAFDALLADSADHLEATKRILNSVALVDDELALDLASQLNTQERRDEAICNVIRAAVVSRPKSLDLFRFATHLGYVANRDQVLGPALTQLMERFAYLGVAVEGDPIAQFFQMIQELPDPFDKATAMAWYARWVAASDPEGSQAALRASIEAIQRIAEPWARIEASFNVARIIAPVARQEAELLIRSAHDESRDNPLARPLLGPVLADAVGLAIIALPSERSNLQRDTLGRIESHIEQIAAPGARADMLCRLATREFLAGHRAEGSGHMLRALAALDAGLDDYSMRATLWRIAGALEKHDLGELRARLVDQPRWAISKAAFAASAVALLRIPSDVPTDTVSARGRADYPAVKDTLELLKDVHDDGALHAIASILTRAVADGTGADAFTGRQMTEIAGALEALAAERLPDPDGIAHRGYLIAFRGLSMRLRAAAQPKGGRANWAELLSEIGTIPNAADRVIVSCWIAELIHPIAKDEAKTLIRTAERGLDEIPDEIDRITRLESIATAFMAIGLRDEASRVVRAAFDLSHLIDDESAYNVQDKLLEKAEAIDPELASSLTPLIDDRTRRYSLEESGRSRHLRQVPNDVIRQEADDPALIDRLARAAHHLRESLSGGRIGTQSADVVSEWLVRSLGGGFPEVMQIVAWACENAAQAGWPADQRLRMASGLSTAVDLARLLADSEVIRDELQPRLPVQIGTIPSKLSVIRAGDRDAALVRIREWMAMCQTDYFVIDDPYFSVRDIEFLREIPPGRRVHVITGLDSQRGTNNERHPAPGDLEGTYKTAWQQRYDDPPPPTDFTVIGTAAGKSPLHDRYIFSESDALRLGTSIGGLGSKESEISIIERDDARHIWAETVQPWVTPPGRLLDGERVLRFAFSIG